MNKDSLVSPKQPTPTPTVHISEYDNIWNQIALEFSRPSLRIPHGQVDMKKANQLKEKLRGVSRRDNIGWWAHKGS